MMQFYEYRIVNKCLLQVGFRLNNGMYVLGPMAIFPRTVLSWNVGNVHAINEDSLLLFCLIEPKIGKKMLCYDRCWFPNLFIHEAVSDSCVKWKHIEDCSILQCVAMYRWQLNRDTCCLHCQGHQSTSKCWYLHTTLLNILSRKTVILITAVRTSDLTPPFVWAKYLRIK